MAGDLEAGTFTIANALAVLLTTEGLLFASLALAANLVAPAGRRPRKLPVPPTVVAALAVTALCLVALGALAAWFEIVTANSPGNFPEWLIVLGILVAIVAMPVLAILLALGLRTEG